MSNYLIQAWNSTLRGCGHDITSTITDGERVWAASNGYVYRLDFENGEERARNDLPGMGAREVQLHLSDDRKILLLGTRGHAWGLDPDSLNTLWELSLPNSGGENMVNVFSFGRTGWAGCHGILYGFDLYSGDYHGCNNLPGMEHEEVRISICSGGETLLVGTHGWVWGLDPRTLDTQWSTSLPGCGKDLTSVEGASDACFAACNGYVYKLHAHNGNIEGKNDLSGLGRHEVRLKYHPQRGRVFVATYGYGVSLNGWDLSERWRLSLPGSGSSITSLAFGKENIYFANNGYVFCADQSGNLISQNDLPGYGRHEVRLAVSWGAAGEERVFAGIDGYDCCLVPLGGAPHGPWMGALSHIIGPKKLREVSIPGTHDSGTYAISSSSSVGRDSPTWMRVIDQFWLPSKVLQAIMANWAVSQPINFTEQLNSGIRYLDLRVQSNPLAFVHGLIGAPVKELMEQLNAYLHAPGNDKEVVLLDFNHFYGMSASDHRELAQMLHSSLGDKLTPASFGCDVTMNKLWSSPHRVIVFYGHPETVDQNDFLWDQNTISSPWPNVQKVYDLKSKLDRELPNTDDGFFVLQGVVTPDGDMIAAGIGKEILSKFWPFTKKGPESLQAVASKVTPSLLGWFIEWQHKHPNINIVICDWAHSYPAYVDMVVLMNKGGEFGDVRQPAIDDTTDFNPLKPDEVNKALNNGELSAATIGHRVADEYTKAFSLQATLNSSSKAAETLKDLHLWIRSNY